MLSSNANNLLPRKPINQPILYREKIPKPDLPFRIRITLSDSQLHTLNQILEISGQSQMAFCTECVVQEINKQSSELLGIIPGGPMEDYHRLYGYWSVKRTLKANWTHHKPNLQLIQDALALYGEDTIKQAIDAYAEIIHNPDMYLWHVQPLRFEDWLSKHIKTFLPDADPHALERYAAPGVRELQALMGD